MTLSWLFRATSALTNLVFSAAVKFLTFFLHFIAFSPQSKVTTSSSMEVARRTSTKHKVITIARGKPDISAHQGRDYLSKEVGEVEELAFRVGSVFTAATEGKSPGPNLHNVDPSFLKTTRCSPKRMVRFWDTSFRAWWNPKRREPPRMQRIDPRSTALRGRKSRDRAERVQFRSLA